MKPTLKDVMIVALCALLFGSAGFVAGRRTYRSQYTFRATTEGVAWRFELATGRAWFAYPSTSHNAEVRDPAT